MQTDSFQSEAEFLYQLSYRRLIRTMLFRSSILSEIIQWSNNTRDDHHRPLYSTNATLLMVCPSHITIHHKEAISIIMRCHNATRGDVLTNVVESPRCDQQHDGRPNSYA